MTPPGITSGLVCVKMRGSSRRYPALGAGLILISLLIMLTACTTAPAPTIPPTPSPTITPAALATSRPTQTPRTIATWTATPAPPTVTPSVTPVPASPVVITLAPSTTPTPDNRLNIGQSTNGRQIVGYRYGDGDRVILLVGGIHGGWEANTVRLMDELRDHFTATPSDIAPGFSVLIIPTMNPDGLAAGADITGRFNGNGVDLNRNWSCGWQPEAVWREGPVDPGLRPFSELETQAMAAFIAQLQPEVALFYHSAADGIFAGDCPLRVGGWRSGQMSAVYGDAAGYTYGRAFSAYPVTGTAPSWVDGLGIASADVELSSSSETQFERNLAGVLAVQCWLQGPACDR